jgi:hypothetical protein
MKLDVQAALLSARALSSDWDRALSCLRDALEA